MTRDDIIRMAREVGLLFDNTLRAPTPRITQKHKDIIRFASLVAAAEREACARMVEPVDESLADRLRGEK